MKIEVHKRAKSIFDDQKTQQHKDKLIYDNIVQTSRQSLMKTKEQSNFILSFNQKLKQHLKTRIQNERPLTFVNPLLQDSNAFLTNLNHQESSKESLQENQDQKHRQQNKSYSIVIPHLKLDPLTSIDNDDINSIMNMKEFETIKGRNHQYISTGTVRLKKQQDAIQKLENSHKSRMLIDRLKIPGKENSKYIMYYKNLNPVHDSNNEKGISAIANLNRDKFLLDKPFYNKKLLETSHAECLDEEALFQLGQISEGQYIKSIEEQKQKRQALFKQTLFERMNHNRSKSSLLQTQRDNVIIFQKEELKAKRPKHLQSIMKTIQKKNNRLSINDEVDNIQVQEKKIDYSFLDNPIDPNMVKFLFQGKNSMTKYYKEKFGIINQTLLPFSEYTIKKNFDPLNTETLFQQEIDKIVKNSKSPLRIQKKKIRERRNDIEENSKNEQINSSKYLIQNMSRFSRNQQFFLSRRTNSTLERKHPLDLYATNQKFKDNHYNDLDSTSKEMLIQKGGLKSSLNAHGKRILLDSQQLKDYDEVSNQSSSQYQTFKNFLSPEQFFKLSKKLTQTVQEERVLRKIEEIKIDEIDQQIKQEMDESLNLNTKNWHINEFKMIDTKYQLLDFRRNMKRRKF